MLCVRHRRTKFHFYRNIAMAASLAELLNGITAKCDLLSQRCMRLSEENRNLRDRLAKADEAIEDSQLELMKVKKELEYVRLTRAYDVGLRDAPEQSRKIISELVRKIDRCIYRLEAE